MKVFSVIVIALLLVSCASKQRPTKEWVLDGYPVPEAELSKIEDACDKDEKYRKAYKMIAGKGGVYNAATAGNLINEVQRCMEGKGLVLRDIKT